MTKREYVRVGTTYYKMVNQPQLRGRSVRKRIPWSVETLRQDHDKNFIADIPKYDGFCTVPSHTDYREEIDNFLNLYEPIDYVPVEGPFPHIESLVRHIFGEQYELGMDYLQLLYLRPVEKLPILLLVSEERNTWQEYVPELSESNLRGQCYLQHQRRLSQPVQLRLGGQTAYRCGRGAAQSPRRY